VGIYALRPRALVDYFHIARDLMLGQGQREPSVQYFRARQQISVDADRSLAVQGDGDVIGQTPVDVKVAPGTVQVITPQNVSSH
jgi:diacylglycerol kinase family enzyme